MTGCELVSLYNPQDVIKVSNYQDYPPALEKPNAMLREKAATLCDTYTSLLNLARSLDATDPSKPSGTGLSQMYDVLETGLGTRKANAIVLWTGLDPNNKGRHVRQKVIREQTGFIMGEAYLSTGLALLREIFPRHFSHNPRVDALMEKTYEYGNMKRKTTAKEYVVEPVKYTRNRLELIRADRNERILAQIENLYGGLYYDYFCRYYRVGNYKESESVGVGGMGFKDIAYVAYVEYIHAVESFLLESTNRRYDFDYETERATLQDWPRFSLSARLRLEDAYNRKRFRERFAQLSENGSLSPEQRDLAAIWLGLSASTHKITRGPREVVYISDRTLDTAAAEEFNQRYPGANLTRGDVYAIRTMILGDAPEFENKLQQYSVKRKIQRIMQDPKARLAVAQRLNKTVRKILDDYHCHYDTIRQIAFELGYPNEYTGQLRIAFERMIGNELKPGKKQPAVSEDFHRVFWPDNRVDFPEGLGRAIEYFAEPANGMTIKSAAASTQDFGLSLPLDRNQFSALLRFIAGDLPERIEYRELEHMKRCFYWLRYKSAINPDLGFLPDIRDYLPLDEADLVFFENSVVWTQGATDANLPEFAETKDGKPNIYQYLQALTYNELAKKFGQKSIDVFKKLNKVMHHLEVFFGPIPEAVMTQMKQMCSTDVQIQYPPLTRISGDVIAYVIFQNSDD
ncbi:hypothetical protein MUP32_02555 [Candidatus Microgenomates bacterium]|nr:hypothetical protein [Candidatus Microgenomates bacterium]